MMRLDEQQQKIVNATERKIAVIACAGAGKTTTLTERIRHLARITEPQNIVAITFTNMAAEEMRERLSNEASGVFIGTIHAYANKLLSRHGYDTSKVINDEKFDEFFKMIKQHPQVIEPVEYLLVDEFQDVSQSEFDFFMQINPVNIFIVGDDYQNIYSWRDARVDLFKNLINDPEYSIYKLENNYRSGNKIINFAECQLGNQSLIQKKVVCARQVEGKVIQTTSSYEEAALFLQYRDDFKDWFILCRSNKEVDDIIKVFTEYGIPTITFKKKDLTRSELKKILEDNIVKVLTIHSAKGLEAKNVMVWSFAYKNDEERRVGYVAATRAKNNLIWCVKRKKYYKKEKTYHW